MSDSPSVQIGPVSNDVAGSRRLVSVGDWRLMVFTDSQDEPRIRDLDLAERLRYAKPHNIRDLIRGMLKDGKLRGIQTIRRSRMVARKGRGEVCVEEEEFWLTEAQALKVIAKSGTDVADQILDEMIDVFRLAIRGLLSPERCYTAEARMALFLLSERQHVARFLSDKLITEICRLYGYGHNTGNQPPQFFRWVAEQIYRVVFGEEIHLELRRRGDKRKYYELLNEDAHRLAQRDLSTLETLAQQSFTPEEFWNRVDAHFRGAPLQRLMFA